MEEIKKVKVNFSLIELLKTPIIKSTFRKGSKDQIEKQKVEYKDEVHKAKEEEVMPIVEVHVDIYKGKTKVLPFLLTLKVFGKNLHNYLIDSGASINVMPLAICHELGLTLEMSNHKVTHTEENVVGELTNIHIQ